MTVDSEEGMQRRDFIVRWGLLAFAPGLLAVGVLRYLYAHGFDLGALASREFILLFIGALAGAPIAGYLWAAVMWRLGFRAGSDQRSRSGDGDIRE